MSGDSAVRGGYSSDLYDLFNPARQVLEFHNRHDGRRVSRDRVVVPAFPRWEPVSPTEIPLLREIVPGRDGLSASAQTFTDFWDGVTLEKDLKLKPETVSDVFGEPEPGIEWVGFDPCGIKIDEEHDFRADLFVGREGATPSPIHHRGYRPQPGHKPAGLEVFQVLMTMPALLRSVWVGEDDIRLWPIIPRLSADEEDRGRTYEGHVEFSWWADDEVTVFAHDWWYNHYGHPWVIPTVRRLDR